MPFDFGVPAGNMGDASVSALEGLAALLASSYGISAKAAYAISGISSMNGRTDERSETVSLGDFESILAFAQLHHLARLSFWSVNRDRACAGTDHDLRRMQRHRTDAVRVHRRDRRGITAEAAGPGPSAGLLKITGSGRLNVLKPWAVAWTVRRHARRQSVDTRATG